MEAMLGATDSRTGGLLLILIQRIEEGDQEFMERKGLVLVVRAVWISRIWSASAANDIT